MYKQSFGLDFYYMCLEILRFPSNLVKISKYAVS